MPGPVFWVLAPLLNDRPLVWANPTVEFPCTPGLAARGRATSAVFAVGVTWICQSTATVRTARSVMVACERVRNDPRQASSATAMASPGWADERRGGLGPRRPG